MASAAARLEFAESGRRPNALQQSQDEYVRASVDDLIDCAWATVRVGLDLLPRLSEKERIEAVGLSALRTYFSVAFGVAPPTRPSAAQFEAAGKQATDADALEELKPRWRAEHIRRCYPNLMETAASRWTQARAKGPVPTRGS